ncbi:hypothetical protein LOD99_8999 [Oopsacas minuta]|uniref:Palmitoyl-protein thioesterase 1 n=1 Tax=Oopsacas minuta TaxID=111878 RepID=A0AAV7JEX2_9METZ|nr:hypothetical protein LOD99_8999 [Oopsacas minuta]
MLIALFFIYILAIVSGYVPLVIWHGMGDSCCNPLSIGRIIVDIKHMAPGIYVHSLQIGNDIVEDTENGFFMEVNKQIEIACNIIRNDTQLRNGYNAMGLSQGGQFLRAVAQRCPQPSMKILLSVGGQHQGVFGFPRCNADHSIFCELIRDSINLGVYSNFIQEHVVQAEYWHDSENEPLYIQKSNFLALINHERDVGNLQDKNNLQKLTLFILVMFTKDTMVEPKETEWFGFYAPGNTKKLIPLNESAIYLEDRLGLKEMNDAKKLRFIACPSDHLEFSNEWFMENLMPYINGTYQ